MKHGHNVTRNKVLQTIGMFPNTTTNEIVDLLPEISRISLQSTISRLFKNDVLIKGSPKIEIREGGKPYSARTYIVNPNAVGRLKRATSPKPASVLTDAGLNARIEELKREVQELKAWKNDALERFPELAVPPLLLRARKFAADEARSSGDNQLATSIMCGHKDNTLLVRVALKVLEEAND